MSVFEQLSGSYAGGVDTAGFTSAKCRHNHDTAGVSGKVDSSETRGDSGAIGCRGDHAESASPSREEALGSEAAWMELRTILGSQAEHGGRRQTDFSANAEATSSRRGNGSCSGSATRSEFTLPVWERSEVEGLLYETLNRSGLLAGEEALDLVSPRASVDPASSPARKRRSAERIKVSVVALRLRKLVGLIEAIPPALGTESAWHRAHGAATTFLDDMAFLLSNNAPGGSGFTRDPKLFPPTSRPAMRTAPASSRLRSETVPGSDGVDHILYDVISRPLRRAAFSS